MQTLAFRRRTESEHRVLLLSVVMTNSPSRKHFVALSPQKCQKRKKNVLFVSCLEESRRPIARIQVLPLAGAGGIVGPAGAAPGVRIGRRRGWDERRRRLYERQRDDHVGTQVARVGSVRCEVAPKAHIWAANKTCTREKSVMIPQLKHASASESVTISVLGKALDRSLTGATGLKHHALAVTMGCCTAPILEASIQTIRTTCRTTSSVGLASYLG